MQTIEMKTCLYTEFEFFSLEAGFDATAIADFYAGLPIGELFEDDFAQTCVDGALMITETNIMGAIKLIIQGNFDFSGLEGMTRKKVVACLKKDCLCWNNTFFFR